MTGRPVRRTPRRRPLGALLLVTLLVLMLGLGPITLGRPWSIRPADAAPASGVTLTVESVSTTTPLPDAALRPLRIVLRVTNDSGRALTGLTVTGVRATPITSVAKLDQAMAAPERPDDQLSSRIRPVDDRPVTVSVPAGGSTLVDYDTITSTENGHGICLCHNAVYPLYFAVDAPDTGDELAHAQTYINAFGGPGQKTTTAVSWLWPLIDRPHRISSENQFIDDDLAPSVQSGRLRRMLDVLTTLAALRTPPRMTVLIDPELIDELAVMQDGYEVRRGTGGTNGTGTLVKGTGSQAARDWLTALRDALAADPRLEVQFTAPSDPNTDSLTRNGLTWTAGLSATAQSRVVNALGLRGVPQSLSWPTGNRVASETLTALRNQGVATVVLPTSALSSTASALAPDRFTTVTTAAGPLAVATLLPTTIQSRWLTPSLRSGGAAALPGLIAQIAIRTVTDQAASGTTGVVLAPPRDFDPDVEAAVLAVRQTTEPVWSAPADVSTAAADLSPGTQSGLAPPDGANELPAATLALARDARRAQQAIAAIQVSSGSSNPTPSPAATLPSAVQRAESNGWAADPTAAATITSELNTSVQQLLNGVHIVKPSSGTYTLTSSNSPLPLTIENTLSFPVRVRLAVNPLNDIPGVSASDVDVRVIASQQTVTIKVPMKFTRSGRFQVTAQLQTPSHQPLGQTVKLTIHSTALGGIGLIITAVAGGLLVLALLVRFTRWLRRRRAQRGSPVPAPAPGR